MGANQLAELSAERVTPLTGLVLLDLRENSIRRFFSLKLFMFQFIL